MEHEIHIALAPETLGTVANIPITNTLVMSWVVVGLLSFVAILVSRFIRLRPNKIQAAFEMIVYGGRTYVEEALGSAPLGRKFFPFIATLFLFILTGNLLEFIPGVGSIGFFMEEGGQNVFAPLFRSLNTDLNVTLALAIISFLVIEISGIRMLGFLKYTGKFVNFKGGIIGFLVGIVELIGNLARLISLSFRLFGNILAGEVLLVVIGSFVPLIAPLPFMAFEVFVGFLQAVIFALLTLAFIRIAVEEPHGEH